jgi:hypothetical protein
MRAYHLNPRQLEIYNYIKSNGPVDRNTISEVFGLTLYYSGALLRQLHALERLYIASYEITLAHPRPYYAVKEEDEVDAVKPEFRKSRLRESLPNLKYNFWGL